MISVPFQMILVAIDESEVSTTAFATAVRLAKALAAKLMIVHVLNPHDIHSPQQPMPIVRRHYLYVQQNISRPRFP